MSALDQAFIKAYYLSSADPEPAPATDAAEDAYGAATCECPEAPCDEAFAAPCGNPEEEPCGEPAAEANAEFAPEAATAVANSFRPMLQVDRLAWPASAAKMGLVAAEALDAVVDRLIVGLARGRKVVGLEGCRRGDGCTTVLLAVARRLAQHGIEVALVDADTDHPRLAPRLGLGPEAGWEAVLTGRLPLADVAIHAVEDRLTVVPFCEPSPEEERQLAAAADFGPMIEALRSAYDLVLVDLGRPNKRSRINPCAAPNAASWLNGAVLVQNVRATPAAEVAQAAGQLEAAGIPEASVVENFV